ncbi:MAG: hypothetical protein AB9917_21775 [Negativicutes bacterium]
MDYGIQDSFAESVGWNFVTIGSPDMIRANFPKQIDMVEQELHGMFNWGNKSPVYSFISM